MKQTKIIAAFYGTGKTWLFQHAPDHLAISDSNPERFKGKNFPFSYIAHLRSLIGRVDIILVPAWRGVLVGLQEAGIPCSLVCPHPEFKEEYMARFKTMGYSDERLGNLDDMWDVLLRGLEEAWFSEGRGSAKDRYILGLDQYLSDVLHQIAPGAWENKPRPEQEVHAHHP